MRARASLSRSTPLSVEQGEVGARDVATGSSAHRLLELLDRRIEVRASSRVEVRLALDHAELETVNRHLRIEVNSALGVLDRVVPVAIVRGGDGLVVVVVAEVEPRPDDEQQHESPRGRRRASASHEDADSAVLGRWGRVPAHGLSHNVSASTAPTAARAINGPFEPFGVSKTLNAARRD